MDDDNAGTGRHVPEPRPPAEPASDIEPADIDADSGSVAATASVPEQSRGDASAWIPEQDAPVRDGAAPSTSEPDSGVVPAPRSGR